MRGLFIGIGGTGDEILARLKDKVYASLGTIPETLQFRLIDTEAEDYRRNKGARLEGDSAETAIGGNEYLQLQDEPAGTFLDHTRKAARDRRSLPEIARWYRADLFQQNLPEADFNLVRGAGQHRQFARMGVFLNQQRLVNMLRFAMEKCGQGAGELPIWIVGSVAGGTGAGLYMDLALLSRLVADQMRMRKRVVGAAVLPEVYQDVGIDGARAYAVIRELERFQAPVSTAYLGRPPNNDEGYRFAVAYDSGTQVYLHGMLFDNLVFYNRKCANVEERRSYFSEIADALNLLLDETAGDEIFRMWINAEEGKATSFNSHRIFLPIKLYERQFVLGAVREVAEGLLPRDPETQALLVGAADDRAEDARKILGEELFSLFRILAEPASEKDYPELSDRMKPPFIVNDMLGFANPAGVFGHEIGPDRERAARRLFEDIFQDIETVREAREDFEDSKIRITAEVARKRKEYEGDGSNSFQASLTAVRSLVEEQIGALIDDSARKYLGSHKAQEQAMGRTIRVFKEIRQQLADVRQNLERVVADDRAALETAKGREKDTKVALDELPKKLLGWRGQLADVEDNYLAAVHQVNQRLQRERLVAFLREMIQSADDRMTRWLEGMQGWQEAIAQVVQACRDEESELSQRLVRQTKIKSASMGLNNTVDMNGYRDALRRRCLLDADTDRPFVEDLLHTLTWRPGAKPQDLELEGWPKHGNLPARDFSRLLFGYLGERIGDRMREFEGMAAYLKWLRDDQRDDVTRLADGLRVVTTNFLDSRQTSATRKLLLLYGDSWNRDRDGDDAFTAIYNSLNGGANIPDLQHNLTDSEGVNPFKDKNVLAILMVDNEIPYQEIDVIGRMKSDYDAVRDEDHPAWRAQAYHLFRCDQEAWRIEHGQIVETRAQDFPEIPGNLVRLLDEPRRVELFAKSLATGIIRQYNLKSGGKIRICAPHSEEDERRLIFLNDPENENDPRDLLRAFVTFMLDQADRRPRVRGTLDAVKIQGWIEDRLTAEDETLEQVVVAYRDDHPEEFEVRFTDTGRGDEIGQDGFLALIMSHYLRPYLES